MFVIIGIVIVFGAVIGGFLMEHGKLAVLIQPAELVIIGGAALWTMLVANPLPVVVRAMKGVLGAFAPSPFNKNFYLECLKMLNDLFTTVRKNGLVKLESDVEDPHKSALFSKYPHFIKN